MFFQRLIDEFGDFVFYRGLFRFYLINHPSMVKQVLMELIVIVAMTVARFRLQVDASDRHVLQAKLTMEPKYGLRVCAKAHYR